MTGEEMSTMLYHSVDCNNSLELQRLIDNGADVNQRYDNYSHRKSILHFACGKDHILCVKTLLRNGASINIKDKWGMTPLMYCLCTENNDIAKLLISRDKTTLEAQDMHGRSSLHIAVENGHEEIISLLLESGCDVNIQNVNGLTPLMYLVASKRIVCSTKLTKLLLESEADVNMPSFRDRRTALHIAVMTKKIDAVETLLQYSADPNQIDTVGMTPLTNLLDHHQHGQMCDDVMTIVVLLLQAGSDMNLSKSDLSNPLFMAIKRKLPEFVRLFLQRGADVNVKFPDSKITPVMMAVSQRDTASVNILLNWNCDLNVTTRCYISSEYIDTDPFQLAILKEAWDIVKLFVLHGYNVSRLIYLRDMNVSAPETVKDNGEVWDFLRHNASSTKSLFQISILAISRAIRHDIYNNLEYLPIPKRIKAYMKDYYL